jgi:hypothetical protein
MAHLHRLDTLDVPLPVPDKLLGQHLVLPGVLPQLVGCLGMPIVHPENPGPLRPGVPRGASLRGLGKKLQVNQGLAAVAERGADAVGARVASANDDDGLVLGADVVAVLERGMFVGDELRKGRGKLSKIVLLT